MSTPSPYAWIRQAEEAHQWDYPIKATINEVEVIVWEDWIEWPYGPEPYEPDHPMDYEEWD